MDTGAVAEATQKKVTRPRAREPDSNNHRGSDTLIVKILMQSKFDWLRNISYDYIAQDKKDAAA